MIGDEIPDWLGGSDMVLVVQPVVEEDEIIGLCGVGYGHDPVVVNGGVLPVVHEENEDPSEVVKSEEQKAKGDICHEEKPDEGEENKSVSEDPAAISLCGFSSVAGVVE